MIEGYKFFNEYFKSNYEVGKTYIYDGEIELCISGFCFSRELRNAFKYYENSKYCYENIKHCCKVIGSGEIIEEDNKIVCSKIYIKEELDFSTVLRELFKDENYYVRSYVAENENCPEDILRKLSEDESFLVRRFIVINKNCPEDILRKLSEDESFLVRANVAVKENCPQDILRKLSKDKNGFVRANVVDNKNCPDDILRELSKIGKIKKYNNNNNNNNNNNIPNVLTLLVGNILQKVYLMLKG